MHRRHFRPVAPPIDALFSKREAGPYRRGDLPRNLKIVSAHAAAAAKSRQSSRGVNATTPTPPPATVNAAALPDPRKKWRPPYSLLFVLGAIALVLSLGDTRHWRDIHAKATASIGQVLAGAALIGSSQSVAAEPAVAQPAGVASPPSEQKINREGHVSIPGGILVFPSSFHTTDGTYDLLIHFHGNTSVVKESVEVADLNAAVAIINLGVGSAPYEEYYAIPGTYEELLADVDHGLRQRGVTTPHLRRVALAGWSAGYGAISTILQVRKQTEDLDAVLIFDGIHCGWEQGALNRRQLKPFADVAAEAAAGGLYFGITHSSIDPLAYASTTATSSYLLDYVGARREARNPATDGPRYVDLVSMANAVSKDKAKKMEPISEARKGSFHVIGYRGETPEHHMAHLFEMSQTLLPELVQRWSH